MRFLKESYLDKEEKFWDYGTKEITKWINPDLPYSEQIFDKSTLGGYSSCDKYMTNEHIVRMTPNEYFERSAKGFNSTFSDQIRQIENDKEKLQYLRDVIFKYHRSFPMPYISDSNGSNQEGRHRMYIAGELYGWDKSFPVLLIP